jgi:hypothetical protein
MQHEFTFLTFTVTVHKWVDIIVLRVKRWTKLSVSDEENVKPGFQTKVSQSVCTVSACDRLASTKAEEFGCSKGVVLVWWNRRSEDDRGAPSTSFTARSMTSDPPIGVRLVGSYYGAGRSGRPWARLWPRPLVLPRSKSKNNIVTSVNK